MSRWRRQLVKRHRAARVRAEQARWRWALFSGDREAVAWHTALPWQRLDTQGRLQPDSSWSTALPPMEVPFLLTSILSLSSSPAIVDLDLVIGGNQVLLDRSALTRGQDHPLRHAVLLLPNMKVELRVTNGANKRGRFRGLLLGETVTPGVALAYFHAAAKLVANTLPVHRGPLFYPQAKP